MRIGNVNMENYRDMMRIFSDDKRHRLSGIKERVRSESGKFQQSIMSWQGTPSPMGRSMTIEEIDAMRAARDPNHIKGLGTSGNNVPPARMIDLPEHMTQGIKDMVRFQFTQNFGGAGPMSVRHGDEMGMLMRSFVREIPQQDRLNAMFTMHRIAVAEAHRIDNAVRDVVPNWSQGQRVSTEIMASVLNGGGGRDMLV